MKFKKCILGNPIKEGLPEEVNEAFLLLVISPEESVGQKPNL